MMASGSTLINIKSTISGKIQKSHMYSDDPVQICEAVNVTANEPAYMLTANYNYGFIHDGKDYWFISSTTPQGAEYVCKGSVTKPTFSCSLISEDDGQTLTFTVNPTTFWALEDSGSCSTAMNQID